MSVTAHTLRTAARDGWANRTSFLLQMLFMIINDVVWVTFWALFFGRTGSIRGWQFDDVVIMFATLVCGGGIALGLFPNCRRIGHLAADGALDEALILPTGTLGHILCRRIDPSNLGDVAFGILLFLGLGHPTPIRLVIFLGAGLLGAVVLTSFLIICSSLTLFLGGRGDQADLALNAIVMFASYPIDLFGGVTKIILFTVLPAAFISGIPAGLVRHFDAAHMLMLAAVAAGLALLARSVFTVGMRRYTSGSVFNLS